MAILIIKMNARPEKCLELKQSLLALAESMRKEKGCLSLDILNNIENDNNICLFEKWESQAALDDHLRSDGFTVLMGTKILLNQPPDITISEASSSSGWEAVEAVRNS